MRNRTLLQKAAEAMQRKSVSPAQKDGLSGDTNPNCEKPHININEHDQYDQYLPSEVVDFLRRQHDIYNKQSVEMDGSSVIIRDEFEDYFRNQLSPTTDLEDVSPPLTSGLASRSSTGFLSAMSSSVLATRKKTAASSLLPADITGSSKVRSIESILVVPLPSSKEKNEKWCGSIAKRGEQQQILRCRQLPCKTYLATGACPYGDKCVFLHDPRVSHANAQAFRIKRKAKDDSVVDSFFWTPMNFEKVMERRDQRGSPHVCQFYVVPDPGNEDQNDERPYAVREKYTGYCVYSMWHYFREYLSNIDRDSLNPYQIKNPCTNRLRLPVFCRLSQF